MPGFCSHPQLSRIVPASLWGEQAFVELSLKAQYLFLFLLTHPDLTSLGALRGRLEWLGQERGWTAGAARKVAAELLKNGLVEEDEAGCVVVIKDYLRRCPPTSLDIVQQWQIDYERLPEGAGRMRALDRIRETAGRFGSDFAREFERVFQLDCPDPAAQPQDVDREDYQRYITTGHWQARLKKLHHAMLKRAGRGIDEEFNIRQRYDPCPIPDSLIEAVAEFEGVSLPADWHAAPPPSPPATPRAPDGRFLKRTAAMPAAPRIAKPVAVASPPPPRRAREGRIECTVRARAAPFPPDLETPDGAKTFLREILNPGRDSPYRDVAIELKVTPL